jgi:hypothetical protein
MMPFQYPSQPHVRRHGPQGYRQPLGYRPWLRDEFTFRCVYCLNRERWVGGRYSFCVDHIVPQSQDPGRALEYDNLVYACSRCNSLKKDTAGIPDPCRTAYGASLRVREDGSVEALDETGELLIRTLRLDNEEYREFRRRILHIAQLLATAGRSPGSDWFGYPVDLPNLSRKRPPGGNSRPAGLHESLFAKRKRGELADAY